MTILSQIGNAFCWVAPSRLVTAGLCATATLSPLSCMAGGAVGLANTTILIIRHAEKPESRRDLSDAGRRHAGAYVKYFSQFELDSKPLKIDALFAAADSKNSRRPRLTLEPLAHALNLPIQAPFNDKNPKALAAELKREPHGKCLLICWHHGEMADLLRALGASPEALLPGGKWPASHYDWLLELRYDPEGNLLPNQCRRIVEELPTALN